MVEGCLPPRLVDVRLEALRSALSAIGEGGTASAGRLALVADLVRHVATDVAEGHVHSTAHHSPRDPMLPSLRAEVATLFRAADLLAPSDAPGTVVRADTRTYGPSHGEILVTTRVLSDDCVGMLRSGPRVASLGLADARRMRDAATLASLVVMDRHPLDVAAVDDLLEGFDHAAERLRSLAEGWTRLDGTSPESRLGRAVASSVSLVREPILAAFHEGPDVLEPLPDADEPLRMTP